MPTPPLPPEITDEIIAWVAIGVCANERAKTLLSCALVCSVWLPASRRLLYEDIEIKSGRKAARLLRSTSALIYLHSTRFLTLSSSFSSPNRAFLHELAGHVPNLFGLAMTEFDTYLMPPRSVAIMSRFSSVRALSVKWCFISSFKVFRRTISSLPSLAYLMIEFLTWPKPSVHLSHLLLHGASNSSRPALSTLSIHSGKEPVARWYLQQLLAWLSNTPTSSSLRKLYVNVNPRASRPPGFRHVEMFGPCFGQNLLELCVGVDKDYPDYEALISRLSRLKRLQLIIYHPMSEDETLIWDRVDRLLRSLPQPAQLCILAITLDLEIRILDRITILDTTLHDGSFPKLRLLQIEVYGCSSVELQRSATIIQEKLPKLSERKIVEVVKTHDHVQNIWAEEWFSSLRPHST
ncbi:hypothetical protein L226DRAFT_386961 [Lentinus tigrinus ALCF2SS1-7]|uniref:F-box domain-containing protein n=1 Tax=Lentinus tigrinus ALCF2SS1-6 TaxID=1328759 RepID=A0A5C2SBK4_9APHY|nr:hypothetical protein L227DRAFT_88395 [Lentinus tigrinus ALCF2SS1-6]RPD75742.1 hypothetical protein L226DRAFT_386961 [Lentinus tigrinus ALCF2SS1-7]